MRTLLLMTLLGSAAAFQPADRSALRGAIVSCSQNDGDHLEWSGNNCKVNAAGAYDINGQHISNWDTGLVTDMTDMFKEYGYFDQPLHWDMSQVTTTYQMFHNAQTFDQDISSWDLQNCETTEWMFRGATWFNNGGQPLRWTLPKVTNVQRMFERASSFNQDLSSWDLQECTHFDYMFHEASAFNNGGVALTWTLHNALIFAGMFEEASSFNQDISSWDTSTVGYFQKMFYIASAFNNGGQPLTWDTSNAVSVKQMFERAIDFNQPLPCWNLEKVEDMLPMFNQASKFAQDLSGWALPPSSEINVNEPFYGNSGWGYDGSYVFCGDWVERGVPSGAFTVGGPQCDGWTNTCPATCASHTCTNSLVKNSATVCLGDESTCESSCCGAPATCDSFACADSCLNKGSAVECSGADASSCDASTCCFPDPSACAVNNQPTCTLVEMHVHIGNYASEASVVADGWTWGPWSESPQIADLCANGNLGNYSASGCQVPCLTNMEIQLVDSYGDGWANGDASHVGKFTYTACDEDPDVTRFGTGSSMTVTVATVAPCPVCEACPAGLTRGVNDPACGTNTGTCGAATTPVETTPTACTASDIPCDATGGVISGNVGDCLCTCESGYEGAECATSTMCDANEYVSSHACVECAQGFSRAAGDPASGPDTTCTDINECDGEPCHADATCTNTPGSFTCACNAGYIGDGVDSCALVATPIVTDTAGTDQVACDCSALNEAQAYQACGCCEC